MEAVSRCVSCGSTALSRFHAKIDPFIIARVPALADRRAELVRCRRCDFTFYDPRLGDEELALLYRGYRDAAYVAERGRYNPGYTEAFNDLISKGASQVETRTRHLRGFLSPRLPFAELRSVLDYGGDRGQYILPEFSQARRVVYEVSGVAPEPGVVTLTDWDEVLRERFDFVMCCHVLEHVSFPGETVQRLKSVAHEGSWIYFEVPAESPFRNPSHRPWPKRLKRSLFGLLPPALGDRLRMLRRRPSMHEHVNLFSLESLTHLAVGNGLRVVHAGEYPLDLGWTRMTVVSCLARLQGPELHTP